MIIKGLSLVLLGIGVFVLMQVVMPFLAFKSWELFAFDQEVLLADPHPGSRLEGGLVAGVAISNINNFPAFIVSDTKLSDLPYREFKITIPKMKLNDSRVVVWTNEFDENLAHLPGTALPGEKGNVFITGHSSLPPPVGNKKAFFATLPNIKKGDDIYVEAVGQTFQYVVEGLKIVDPKDVSVINAPDPKGRYLSLMTCVPPGFNTKRLVVLAKLKS